MNSNWFRRLLLSYLPAFFIVITILFAVFLQALNEQNRREAIKANEFLAQQVIRYTDNALKTLDYRILRDILSTPVLQHFFRVNSNDVYGNIQAMDLMEDWKFNFPIIDSAYFLRVDDRFVLGDGAGQTTDFQDEPFLLPFIEQHRDLGVWTGKRTYKPYPSERPTEVITIVRGYPHFASAKTGYIVVNVSLSKLRRAIAPMYNPDLTYVRMSDGDGASLVSGNAEDASSRSVFSHYVSPYTGWEIDSGPANRGLTRMALDLYNIWFIMALAAVLLGAIWVVHVTRRNYRPISQLVALIRTSSWIQQDDGKPAANEFGFIRGALEHFMEETKKNRQQHQETLILQKKHRFQEALEGVVPIREAEWQADLIRYNVNPAGPQAFVLILEIDRYNRFVASYHAQDQSILKFLLSSAVQEMVQLHGASVWAEWTADRRLSAVVWIREAEDGAKLRDAIGEQIVEWVRGNLSFTVTLGVHGMAVSLEEIRRSGDIAGNLLSYKAVLGTARLIRPEVIEGTQPRIHEFFGTIHALSQAVRLPESGWLKHLDELFKQIHDSVSSRKEIESLLQFLHQQLSRVFLELSKEYRDAWKDAEAEWLRLESEWETVHELQSACGSIFCALSGELQKVRDSQRNRAVIGDIRTYIEKSYANPELSLDHLSDRFVIHAKNISKLFKEEFGGNFVDFLIGLRMDHAKRMLQKSDKSLQEISAEVGYNNYNSFNRAFKNSTGISPSDYRKQAHP
ncbi:helix-turn-helix domain-containing protein [Cohnella nanjingensis]|uniref:Helix-turn-helix domain-containing protein n=1 Tax=Cohnella nanjingensis TaxID=1387779 RepID=A0A7X0RRL4_9BACL|nr:helix-turn-helix domain-containing protein [Cohnella nanjingensis]MBB6672404.1 helix-turn-helix domain-containing protein [Cohnella nanjingensis]